jgi:curved DNA-binding protein CbpA
MSKIKDEFEVYNFYKILGISENATNEQIDAAYKQFIRVYHSDKTGLGDLPVKIANNAKEILKNPVLRTKHNDFIHSEITKANQSPHNNLEEIETLKRGRQEILLANEKLRSDIKKVYDETTVLRGIIIDKKNEIEKLKKSICHYENDIKWRDKVIYNLNTENNNLSNISKELQSKYDDILRLYNNKGKNKLNNAGCVLIFVAVCFITLGFEWLLLGYVSLSIPTILAGSFLLYTALRKR